MIARVSRDDVQALVRSLGLEPLDVTQVRLLPDRIEVTSLVRDERGRTVLNDERNGPRDDVRSYAYWPTRVEALSCCEECG